MEKTHFEQLMERSESLHKLLIQFVNEHEIIDSKALADLPPNFQTHPNMKGMFRDPFLHTAQANSRERHTARLST